MPDLSNPRIAAALTLIGGVAQGAQQERQLRNQGEQRLREMSHKSRMGRIDADYEHILAERRADSAAKRRESDPLVQSQVEANEARVRESETRTGEYVSGLKNKIEELKLREERAIEERKAAEQSAKEKEDLETRRQDAREMARGMIQLYDQGLIQGDKVKEWATGKEGQLIDGTSLWNRLDMDDFAIGIYREPRNKQESSGTTMGQIRSITGPDFSPDELDDVFSQ